MRVRYSLIAAIKYAGLHHACTTFSAVIQGEYPQAILEDSAAETEGTSIDSVFLEECVAQRDDHLVPITTHSMRNVADVVIMNSMWVYFTPKMCIMKIKNTIACETGIVCK